MVTPNTKVKRRVGLHCPHCGAFINMREGIEARLSDDQRTTAAWFQGRQCSCGMRGNICMSKRDGRWVPVAVSMVRE